MKRSAEDELVPEETKKQKPTVEVTPAVVGDRDPISTEHYSPVQHIRLAYEPPLPTLFEGDKIALANYDEKPAPMPEDNKESIQKLFPNTVDLAVVTLKQNQFEYQPGKALRVAIVFSGGQAAGGHNVVCGLYRYLKARCIDSQLLGFIGGPIGIVKGRYIEITEQHVKAFKNMGGFHMIDSGRDKIQTAEQFASSAAVCDKLKLDGLVIVGGDDSNTNAAVLAEYFKKEKCHTRVISAPKTIDGDLKNYWIEVSFGFDSATKVFAGLIGNVMSDAASAKKYYHFIRLMGREASHISLECALQTHPNCLILGEEVAAKKHTLKGVTNILSDIIVERARLGKNYGVFLIPEGLIEFIPELKLLLSEMNEALAKEPGTSHSDMLEKLTPSAKAIFEYLPTKIRKEMMMDRDPHGNVQVSKIETEKLLITTVTGELRRRAADGKYAGSFAAINHFFGYEGRSCEPSPFDSNYCYTLGHTIGSLIELEKTGLVAVVKNLTSPDPKQWQPCGIPVSSMLHIERRKGHEVPVIKKALVDLHGKPFFEYKKLRRSWVTEDKYSNPGGLQYEGTASSLINLTVQLEQSK